MDETIITIILTTNIIIRCPCEVISIIYSRFQNLPDNHTV